MRQLGLGLALSSVILVGCTLGLAAAGCGDDDRTVTPTDSGVVMLDGAPPTDGPARDTGPRVDSGGSTGMCPAGDCNLLTNGCPMAGQACYFLAAAAGSPPAPTCDTSGTAGDGAACTDYQDCAEGFFCDTAGGNVCRHYCCGDSDVGCPAGQTCAVHFVLDGMDTGVGYCKRPTMCDPILQTGCAAGEACYIIDLTDGTTDCFSHNGVTAGMACESANDCAPGTACLSLMSGAPNLCYQYCDTMATPSTCVAPATCTSLGIETLPNAGICVAPSM